jgi:hypothetical protein
VARAARSDPEDADRRLVEDDLEDEMADLEATGGERLRKGLRRLRRRLSLRLPRLDALEAVLRVRREHPPPQSIGWHADERGVHEDILPDGRGVLGP